jgi:DNA-binding NarL/FixJ family response regulator
MLNECLLKPDVIVADISMPRRSGIEAPRQLEEKIHGQGDLSSMHADVELASEAIRLRSSLCVETFRCGIPQQGHHDAEGQGLREPSICVDVLPPSSRSQAFRLARDADQREREVLQLCRRAAPSAASPIF